MSADVDYRQAALTLCEALVQQVAQENITAAEALHTIGRYGLTADREALAECVAAIQLRDTFLMREGDPYAFTGTSPRPEGPNPWDLAVELCEQSLRSHLLILAERAA